jgi:hypothetical protein
MAMQRLMPISLFALCASTAYAEPAPSTPAGVPCIFVNRIFSDGAVICSGGTAINAGDLQCNAGKWEISKGTSICNGAPATDIFNRASATDKK